MQGNLLDGSIAVAEVAAYFERYGWDFFYVDDLSLRTVVAEGTGGAPDAALVAQVDAPFVYFRMFPFSGRPVPPDAEYRQLLELADRATPFKLSLDEEGILVVSVEYFAALVDYEVFQVTMDGFITFLQETYGELAHIMGMPVAAMEGRFE